MSIFIKMYKFDSKFFSFLQTTSGSPSEQILIWKLSKPLARLAFALNNHDQINGEKTAYVDNIHGHLWIYDSEPNHRCQCGMVTFESTMKWTPISILTETLVPKSTNKFDQNSSKLNLKSSKEKSWLLDLASAKRSAILAALETAETLSSVGTVLHLQ